MQYAAITKEVSLKEPASYEEASKSKEWRQAMDEEI